MGTFVIGVGPLVNVLAHDVVPPDHRVSFAVYERGAPVGEQHLHFAIIVEILFFHEAADVAVGFPKILFGGGVSQSYENGVATWDCHDILPQHAAEIGIYLIPVM